MFGPSFKVVLGVAFLASAVALIPPMADSMSTTQVAEAATSNQCYNNGTQSPPAVYGSYLPSGYQIYTPWGGDAGPSSNGSVTDFGYAYGTGDHWPCTSASNSNDYFAVDYNLKTGDEVFPHTAGTVQYAGPATGGYCSYGNIVYVTFTQGLSAIYVHLSAIYVSQGQHVDIGTAIGAAGSSGNGCNGKTFGPHLHTAIYENAAFQYSGSIGPYGGSAVVPEPIKAFVFGTVYQTQYVGETMTY